MMDLGIERDLLMYLDHKHLDLIDLETMLLLAEDQEIRY